MIQVNVNADRLAHGLQQDGDLTDVTVMATEEAIGLRGINAHDRNPEAVAYGAVLGLAPLWVGGLVPAEVPCIVVVNGAEWATGGETMRDVVGHDQAWWTERATIS